jgi:hypothetical protein
VTELGLTESRIAVDISLDPEFDHLFVERVQRGRYL